MKWRCPHCRREIEAPGLEAVSYAPFCSKRCKMADLYNWLDERYTVSRPVDEADIDEAGLADIEPPPGWPGSVAESEDDETDPDD